MDEFAYWPSNATLSSRQSVCLPGQLTHGCSAGVSNAQCIEKFRTCAWCRARCCPQDVEPVPDDKEDATYLLGLVFLRFWTQMLGWWDTSLHACLMGLCWTDLTHNHLFKPSCSLSGLPQGWPLYRCLCSAEGGMRAWVG